MTNPPDYRPADVLAIGTHPDDVEIAAAGTLLRLIAEGLSVCLVDLTRGEKATTGSAAEREREAAAAADRLGLRQRHNLGLPDGGVQADTSAVDRIVAAIRAVRPRLLLAPLVQDTHPDHRAAAEACRRAVFLAGLTNHAPDLGAAWRPPLVLHYPGNTPCEPTLAVDIGELAEAKARALSCYTSQLAPTDRTHLPGGLDILERAQLRDRYLGARVGVAAAEAFVHDGPIPLSTVSALLRR